MTSGCSNHSQAHTFNSLLKIMAFRLSFACLLGLLCALISLDAAEPLPSTVQRFISDNCLKCHDHDSKKGDFRIDNISPNAGHEDTPKWIEIMERINSGEMPPKKEKTQPSPSEKAAFVEWIAARLKDGESARMAKRDRVSLHRLSRDEYVHTVRDLLGVVYDATDPGGLLEDPEWHGFERIGSVLTLSPSHIEKYMKAAETVLNEAYPETPVTYCEATKRAHQIGPENRHYQWLKDEGLLDKVRHPPMTSAGEIFRGSNPWHGKDLKFPGPGLYEVSYTVSGLKPENGRAPRMQVYEEKLDRILFEQDIVTPEDKPITVRFQAHFPEQPQIHVMNQNGIKTHPRTNAESYIPFISTKFRRAPWQMKITDEKGNPRYPVLILDEISMRGPLVSDQEQQRRASYLPEQPDETSIKDGLQTFATRAFRRPLRPGELDPFLKIVTSEQSAGATPRNALKAAMAAILCSKGFLFLAEGDDATDRNHLNAWELASRLSYMIWSTMPDDELVALARSGEISRPDILQAQCRRLLADPKAARFTQSFSTQWLRLRKVGMFPPDKKIYPNYDAHLERSMVTESQSFFAEVLQRNLSLREFIDSEWTMVNPKLAGFYGLQPFDDDTFQRVALKPENHRGGLLTQAAILSLTSDGTRQRPVHRGAWISEVFLGRIPPPPPANVDPIEPNPVDAPKATLRTKLQAHKHDPNCAACHQKIDPLGFAFDHYNAIGEWRTHEKVGGTGDDPVVDATGELPDGRRFTDAKEFRKLLLEDIDRFNVAFIEKLATYATRRPISFDDRASIQDIAKKGQAADYRVKDILEALVSSKLFQQR